MTTKLNDGGPAFARPHSVDNHRNENGCWAQDGMSLRDYFAAKAPHMPVDLYRLALEFADTENPDLTHHEKSERLLGVVAKWNFIYADAMIAEREKGGE